MDSNNQLRQLIPMGRFRSSPIIPLIAAIIVCGSPGVNAVKAAELSASAHAGLDTNPHRLSSGLDPDMEFLSLLDLKFSNRFDNDVSIRARSKHARYPGDDRGDWSRTEFDLGYRGEFEVNEKRFKYRLSTDWIDRDKNYVSRTTGEDATFGGESITDRYDYQQLNLNAEISYRTQNKTRLRARYQRRDKDYEDFSIPGLSNFDYDHNRYRFDVQFRLADQHRVSFEIGDTERAYEDRRAEDLDGNDIAGSDLEYDYTEYSAGYSYRPDKSFQFFLEVSFSDRSDNGVGYNDSTYDSVYLSWRKKLSPTDEVRASLTYSEFNYDNRSFSDTALIEEDAFDNDGYLLKLDYKRKLPQYGDEKLTLIYELQLEDYDSSDERYRYDRAIVSVGLRYDFL